jgi:hypothetical protein
MALRLHIDGETHPTHPVVRRLLRRAYRLTRSLYQVHLHFDGWGYGVVCARKRTCPGPRARVAPRGFVSDVTQDVSLLMERAGLLVYR